MSQLITSASTFEELAETEIDANSTSTVTASLDISESRLCIFQVLGNTGAHTSHVLTLQCSLDDSVWNVIAGATVTGAGVKGEIEVASQFIRLKVTTAEGGASTVDIIIQAK